VSWYFLEYSELFFFTKCHAKGPRTGGPGPRGWLMGSRHSETISVMEFMMMGCDFVWAKGYFPSNLERGSRDGPLGFNELTI
jgi:hypothetical protein